jgi:WD40 repeat protein
MVGTNNGWIASFDLETGSYLPNTWNSNPSSSVNLMKLLDANTLVSASSDKTLTVWNLTVSSPTVISTFTSHTDAVNRVDKLANGNVVSVGVDKTLYIWNPITGSMVTNRYSAHTTTILSLKVLLSGYIATGGSLGDNIVGTLQCWDRRKRRSTDILIA